MKVKFPTEFYGKDIVKICQEVAEEKGLGIKVEDLYGESILEINKKGGVEIHNKPYESTGISLSHPKHLKPKFFVFFQLNEVSIPREIKLEIRNPNKEFFVPVITDYFSTVSQKLFSQKYPRPSG